MAARRRTALSLEETFEVNSQKANEAKKALISQVKSQIKTLGKQLRQLQGKKKSKRAKKAR